ncbi:MAG: hypothetical protein WHX52_12085 [Anaerolineae bacterium]
MAKRNHILSMLVIGLVLWVSLACGSSNEGVKVTPASVAATPTASSPIPAKPAATQAPAAQATASAPSTAAVATFKVGDLVEVEHHTIRLNRVEYQGDILIADFTIENKGSSDVNVSSLMSFSAKKADGTSLSQEIFDCPVSGLDGKVLPGDRLRGGICWSGASPDDGIRIYYQASLFGKGAVVWDAVAGTAEPLETETGSAPTGEVYKVGDLVQVGEHTIRLNRVEYRGEVLVANFSIENHGAADLSVSSALSFSARRGDGTKLEQEIFDCDAAGLDGSVLSGDRLRGSICWSGAGPEQGIKLYYEASLFGRGAVVWEAVAAASEPDVSTEANLKVETFAVGDVVQVGEHTIVLNAVTWKGDVLQANFTIENQGNAEVLVSSMASFYARARDGSTLEQTIFDCGSSLDGKVLPGDKLRGDICWSGAHADAGIKIYYKADVFGKGAVVWRVE